MFFSSKISNSILSYCDREGIERAIIYNHSSWPEEFLKDPSCWLEAGQLESFLGKLDSELTDIERIALQSAKLHAWGPLDSVLKLMGKPQDIFTQPDRFLSYFISPPPPVDFLERSESSISFRIPISSEEYPVVTRYLKGALESLPVFVGQSPASVIWSENIVSISWASSQASLVNDKDDININPNLIQDLNRSMERSQKELEEKNRELQARFVEIQNLKIQVEEAKVRNPEMADSRDRVSVGKVELQKCIEKISKSVYKLQDYLLRAQQLITVLVGSERSNPIIRSALKKVDWEQVTQDTPRLTLETNLELQRFKKTLSQELPCHPSDKFVQEKFSIAEDIQPSRLN